MRYAELQFHPDFTRIAAHLDTHTKEKPQKTIGFPELLDGGRGKD